MRGTLLAVGLGGAVGTGARAGLSLAALHMLADAAFIATLAANILGAALIGYLATRALPPVPAALLMTGFCGGFTTFSLFSLEVLVLMETSVSAALAYGAVSLVLWIAAVSAGYRLGRGQISTIR
ncbi:fluoride efflux transporter FluC [Roseinatronobacter alkalisoli]|uniref:Fluoride-specific ion channel FluC n=1 Tax=Roseinatronobacter alkalisoli TaxID=3028235 RepID=A0ABT5T4M6_9RHOB|nr:CrcB family protein [Roseinatronobacter sp. HJB301]MDD7970060.1 CrcB family protein [Roseinatronobacter sp. HJB301]